MESSGLLQRVWVTFPSLPSSVQTAYLLGSSWLHSTAAAVLDGHSMALASPKPLWSSAPSGQHYLSRALFQNSRSATVPNLSCSPWLSKPVPPGWSSPAANKRNTSATTGTQFLCAEPEETLPRELHLHDAALFLITADSSAPADQHPLSQQSKGFSLVVLVSC